MQIDGAGEVTMCYMTHHLQKKQCESLGKVNGSKCPSVNLLYFPVFQPWLICGHGGMKYISSYTRVMDANLDKRYKDNYLQSYLDSTVLGLIMVLTWEFQFHFSFCFGVLNDTLHATTLPSM